jgi:hypothetical protein
MRPQRGARCAERKGEVRRAAEKAVSAWIAASFPFV